MKQLITLFTVFYFAANIANAQEVIQELSKKSAKGYITETDNSTGNYLITYKIGGNKKKNEIFYETYLFDKNMKLIKNEEIAEPKLSSAEMPDKKETRFSAYVGGCGMEVLSIRGRVQGRGD